MTEKKIEFRFGDKVHDWLDKKNYIIMGKMRGRRYRVINSKQVNYRIGDLRLKRGWRQK